jgi:hypothetical protein
MQLKSDERRRARFQKLYRLFLRHITWPVVVSVAQAVAWLVERIYPQR